MQEDIITEPKALLMDENYMRLAEFFHIEERSEREDNLEALKEVYDWAKEKTASEDPIDVLLHLRSIERTLLGDPSEPRLTKVRRYVALSQEQEKLDKEMKLLQGTNE